ncbi:aldehyde dehydrogenase family protein [Actinomadura sp. NPDC000600]|uniref:aldehyde dehydrogenase family protein n=1 Tax=Actinomadura sp. NPDC000600 TaxID=3154262 RepID=UPI003398D480
MNPVSRAGGQFIGGRWERSAASGRLDVENPATGEVVARVCEGGAADAERAVHAARDAFPGWSSTPHKARALIVREVCARLAEQADELAELISTEVGTPLPLSREAQVARPTEVLRSLCDAASEVAWTERVDSTVVVREPLGVVVAITPWNFPLHQVVAKVGAALLAGCTVVLKPSELAPLSAYALADALHEAGLPAGAFNVVTGLGSTVGEALTAHPDVDGISFTGSSEVGRRIGAVAAASVKRVGLELGGKGPSLVLPGADTGAAATATAARCFTNSGQVCAALTRLIVPRDRVGAAEAALAAFVEAQRIGDPFAEGVTIGPLISAPHKERVLALLARGVRDGARVVAGGPGVPVPSGGHYVAPTVLSDVDRAMEIARVEVFGPVLCVLAYDDVDEGVAIANDSEYGLVGAVWGPDAEAAAAASRLRVGMVGVNGGRLNVRAPFGGYKQSGHGREFGRFGIEHFLELKSVNFPPGGRVTWPEP